ncbi:MAG: hypothetical protein JF587_25015 [Catenulisporales bacterium]|jgi:hypothetical protein|nr:hypothetical protein [Catenulisporales bacterium]
MKFLAVYELVVEGDLTDFDEQTDRVLEELLDMAGVYDPDIAVGLATGKVDVQLIVDAEDQLDAQAKSACALRAAVHATGGCTPGWEAFIGASVTSRVSEAAMAAA